MTDQELLDRVEKLAKSATHPLAKSSYEADARYLRGLIDRERSVGA